MAQLSAIIFVEMTPIWRQLVRYVDLNISQGKVFFHVAMKIGISCFPNILDFLSSWSTFEGTSFWAFAQHCGLIHSGDMTIYILILMWVSGRFAHFCWNEILTSQFWNGISPERIKLQSPAKAQIESISSSLRICICRSFSFGLRGNKTNGKKDEIYFRYCYLFLKIRK